MAVPSRSNNPTERSSTPNKTPSFDTRDREQRFGAKGVDQVVRPTNPTEVTINSEGGGKPLVKD